MNDNGFNNEDIFECKMYITDLETNKNSKEIDVSDLVFKDWIEFEFGDYEDEDYGTLPYKDFKFFINDYSVTFYSPQYHKLQSNWNSLRELIEKEKTRLAKECSHTYEDSLGKTKLVNEDIFNELNKISDRMNELKVDKI